MGKISQGVLGGFSGKLGNVVGASWKGIDYMRIKPASVANPKTEGQLDQRSKFALVIGFLKTMTAFIRVGFKLYANGVSQFNSAMSYLLNNAIAGEYPNQSIDYASVLISRGSLEPADGAQVSSDVASVLEFSWTDNSDAVDANADDVALLLAYNPTKKASAYAIAGFSRSDAAASLQVPSGFSGDEVQVFLGFISSNGQSVANSVYVGAVNVA